MRKAAIGLGILIVLLLAGLSVAPRFVDLDRFKAPIAAELARRTGRQVEIAGPIALSLLTAPTVTAYDLRLANPPGAAVKDMVRLPGSSDRSSRSRSRPRPGCTRARA